MKKCVCERIRENREVPAPVKKQYKTIKQERAKGHGV
jgi:hypothetical protein